MTKSDRRENEIENDFGFVLEAACIVLVVNFNNDELILHFSAGDLWT